ncbi:hypothetical protein [Simplicispira piscis]
MQLEKRVQALEALTGANSRIRVVCLRDGETKEQAQVRVGSAGVSVLGTAFFHHTTADPERVAKLEAGIAPNEMTLEELVQLRKAIIEG